MFARIMLAASGFLVLLPLGMTLPATPQRIQDGAADVCWSPDYEWPVPCDDE